MLIQINPDATLIVHGTITEIKYIHLILYTKDQKYEIIIESDFPLIITQRILYILSIYAQSLREVI